MKGALQRAAALCAALILTGCAGDDAQGFLSGDKWSLESAAALPPPDDPYLAALREVQKSTPLSAPDVRCLSLDGV